MKKALVTGITGQDGKYLTELLLRKGYEVHGLKRRASTYNTDRIDHIDPDKYPLFMHFADITDPVSLIDAVKKVEPDEIYNLAAQSHVGVSFQNPYYTAQASGVSCLNILEAVRLLGMEKKTKFYQASTSELYGKVQKVPQDLDTPFYPRSPYGCAKLYAFWTTKNYREAYDMFATNGILFNHESPFRGNTFVTRKITIEAAKIKAGLSECLQLGNLDAKRDWGFAGDYVDGMYRMLQAEEPEDFILATGKTYTVRDFVNSAFKALDIELEFSGSGIDEVGRDKNGKTLVKVNERYYRPTEVDLLIGDASYAKEKLDWEATTSLEELVSMMVKADYHRVINKLPWNVEYRKFEL